MADITLNLTIQGNQGSIRFEDPIHLPGKASDWTAHLSQMVWYNSVRNITSSNNTFHYSLDGTPYSVTIPEGAYELTALSDQLVEEMVAAGHSTTANPRVEIIPNLQTLGSEILVDNINYTSTLVILFSQSGGFESLLGFDSSDLSGSSRYVSDRIVDIEAGVSQIQLTCSILNASSARSNGRSSAVAVRRNILYSTTRTVPPGYKMYNAPNNPVRLPLNTTVISDIYLALLDQDGRPVPMAPREQSNLVIVLKRVKNIAIA